jgi:hypothetical protein
MKGVKGRVGRLIDFTASLEFTVYILLLFLILVIWGTVYQASNGLYAAQKEIFHAWVHWVTGFIPIPGLILVGAALFLNLLAALILRIPWRLQNAGLLLIHLGLIVFLVGGFVARRLSQESFLTLVEGEASGFCSAYRDWEIALWSEHAGVRTVAAIPIRGLRAGEVLTFKAFGRSLTVDAVYPNSRLSATEGLLTLPVQTEAELNLPGLVLRSESGERVLLHASQAMETPLAKAHQNLTLSLRPRRFPLPVVLKLLDFRKTTYPGSEIPKGFESQVELLFPDGFRREARISMNRPLRIGPYTFYQSSYDESGGLERSTFSVVRNRLRLLPYAASLLTFLGLLWFGVQTMWGFRVKKTGQSSRGEK